ncbi:MAG TPA: EAL domain-containing protein [Thermoanaerobaculia bacterium]|nr:EAL domain-containing protein [Thermoanaerobaculia bacterium]
MGPLQVVIAISVAAVSLAIIVRQIAAVRAARELDDTNRFATEIIENAGEGIVVYDRELRYLLWNRFMEELTGMPAADVLGRPATELFPHLAEQQVDDLLRRAFDGESVASPDVHYYIPTTGRRGWVSSVYRPHYDEAGNIVGVIGLIRDVTQRKEAEQQIEYQAYHDALTGLANRRLFQEHLSLALALAQRRNSAVAVLFLDLDHFKTINDSLGHTVGDELLREVARRLKATVREGDTVARVGGDEFTIVLQELPRGDAAAAVAQKVLRTIAEPMEISGHRLYVTTSIGITLFPDDGDDAEALLKNADTAMYRAKADGRNTYQMSTRDLSRTTHERMTLENGLHRALEQGEFELLYQPQVEIDEEETTIVGMEALLRWNHPGRGVIAPEDFIGLAEERGLILPIGDWVIREACHAARRFHDNGFPRFRVAVNISARQFRDPSLLATVESALQESGIDPRTLELEITETVAMEDVELTMSSLAELRKRGVTIAIDDFGTGHSSLSYLKRFPIDALKIDKGFVLDLPDKFEDAAIVSSVIQLANGLGLRVIAEGVEKREQLDFLRDAGCRDLQGFYFSHPVRVEEVEKLLAQGVGVG